MPGWVSEELERGPPLLRNWRRGGSNVGPFAEEVPRRLVASSLSACGSQMVLTGVRREGVAGTAAERVGTLAGQGDDGESPEAHGRASVTRTPCCRACLALRVWGGGPGVRAAEGAALGSWEGEGGSRVQMRGWGAALSLGRPGRGAEGIFRKDSMEWGVLGLSPERKIEMG